VEKRLGIWPNRILFYGVFPLDLETICHYGFSKRQLSTGNHRLTIFVIIKVQNFQSDTTEKFNWLGN